MCNDDTTWDNADRAQESEHDKNENEGRDFADAGKEIGAIAVVEDDADQAQERDQNTGDSKAEHGIGGIVEAFGTDDKGEHEIAGTKEHAKHGKTGGENCFSQTHKLWKNNHKINFDNDGKFGEGIL